MTKTFTIKDFAKELRISDKAARLRIKTMERERKIVRISEGVYPIVYQTALSLKERWHDPFNKCKRGDHEKIIDCVIASYVKRKGPVSERQ